jgi:hypothetical protein
MKKIILTLFLFFYTVCTFSQETNSSTNALKKSSSERFPVFPNCINLQATALENCFYNQVQSFIFQNFEVPEKLKQNQYKGEVKVLFEVDDKGVFKVIYVSSEEESLRQEAKNTFDRFPNIEPSTYNGSPIYYRFNTTITIPLSNPEEIKSDAIVVASSQIKSKPALTELDDIVYKEFKNPEFESHLNVPF